MSSISTDGIGAVECSPTPNGATLGVETYATPRVAPDTSGSAVLDSAHVGDIIGAFGGLGGLTHVGRSRWQQLRC